MFKKTADLAEVGSPYSGLKTLPSFSLQGIPVTRAGYIPVTRAGAATTPGHALNVAYDRKMAGAGEQCRQQGIAFIPVVAESLGGWHPAAVEQIRKLGSALARHTGQEESEAISHLVTRCSILLQRGLTAFVR